MKLDDLEHSDVGLHLNFKLSFETDSSTNFTFDVELNLPASGVSAVYGRSGSGKTTLLRCIAGLIRSPVGHLTVAGECWQDHTTFLASHRRSLGYVFQDASLFSHLNAEGNLEYARKRAKLKTKDTEYQKILEVLDIKKLLKQYPYQLSGGERQRVGIARALLTKPKILLMDEPLSSLDQDRKSTLLPYLERLQEITSTPILYVSHSLDEITRLADQVIILDKGRVMACGAVTDVFSMVQNYSFGDQTGAVLQTELLEICNEWSLIRVGFSGGELWVPAPEKSIKNSIRVRILAKDVTLTISEENNTSALNHIRVEVVEIIPESHSAMNLVRLRSGQEYLIARVTRRSCNQLAIAPGCLCYALIKSVSIIR